MAQPPVSMHAIRQLRPDDAEIYQALRLRGLREHPEAFTSSAGQEADKPLAWSRQRLESGPARPHDLFLGAFSGAMLQGLVGLQGRYRPKEQHNASLVGMYVPLELAGQGVGLALVQALLLRARSMPDLTQIDLTVTAGNGSAQALYARCGFVVVGVLPRAIRVGDSYHDKIHMQLRLG